MRSVVTAVVMAWACCLTLPASAVEINTATQAELESLPGVGVSLGDRILAQRAQAPFKDWADLIHRVKGVRAAMAVKLSAAGLTVAGNAYEITSPPRAASP